MKKIGKEIFRHRFLKSQTLYKQKIILVFAYKNNAIIFYTEGRTKWNFKPFKKLTNKPDKFAFQTVLD